MLWRRSPQPLTIPPTTPVPDAEALRRAALQASWRRDRWVARRRVLLRWLLWASGRYLMPAMLVFGMGAWLWLGVLSGMGNPLDRLAIWRQPAASPSPVAPAPTVAVASPNTPQEPPDKSANADDNPAFSPEGEELPKPLRLRFESRWVVSASSTSSSSSTATVSAEADTSTTIQPHLKPENWLHSKEP